MRCQMHNKEQFELWLQINSISLSAYNNLIGNATGLEDGKCICDERMISVTISTHNRSEMLIRLLDSIIRQNYTNFEIIIIDDRSTDNTGEVIRSYIETHKNTRIRYFFNEKNEGVSFSKKRGFLLCEGDIIIFSDDDDYYIDDEYFAKVNSIYANDPDCSMTVASTIYHYEIDDTYTIKPVNYHDPVDNKDFLNGFGSKYKKPGSMFTLTLSAEKMRSVHFEDLKCFNDMSLYLYGALAPGRIFPITEAVGVYSVQVLSMTSGVSSEYTINNLDAKSDIGKKAVIQNYISEKNFSRWLYEQSLPTLMNFYNGNIMSMKEYNEVNRWILNNLCFPYKYKALLYGMNARIRHTLDKLRMC